ncbi:hypothetical protein B9Z55_016733 [Caenorhabditis nigoni]|uniref:Uncharacterized protein n=1 Tax=Caenorhabditis nigoni TaxID=1611254 RepID=A0A2G5T6J0_9PELO|nr:hypothetical protein B9Z55_016733 [Caenorhabditis nigoni]
MFILTQFLLFLVLSINRINQVSKETQILTSEWMDEEIQRALRGLTESRGLLDPAPRISVFVEKNHENQKTVTTTITTSTETDRSTSSRVEALGARSF